MAKIAVKAFFGLFFIASGLRGISSGIGTTVVGFLLGGALLLWAWRDMKPRILEKQLQQEVAEAADAASKTFSFKLYGVTYPCQFANAPIHRQTAIEQSKIGDSLFFHEYEWEGAMALAVINRRTGHDIGVVPAVKVARVKSLIDQYDVSGVLIRKEEFVKNGQEYIGCDVRIDCVER